MTTTIQVLQAVLKNFYIGPIQNTLNDSTVLLAQLKKSSKEVVGEQVVLPLHVGRNWGVGARGTTGNGTLPTARNQQYDKATFATKDVYGRIEIRGKTIRATKSDKGAFLRVIESETKGMSKDLASDINRQLNGNADGILTTVAANAGPTTTITVANTQYLEDGMYVDIGGDVGIEIVSVDSETQITVGSSITVVSGENIRITGTTATDELNGLALITNNSGTLENIDPTTAPYWKAKKFGSDSAPVPLTEDDMQEVQDAIEKAGGELKMITTSYAGRRAYVKLLTTLKRFTSPQTGKLKGGFEYIDFNNVPLTVDRHVQESSTTTRMNFLDTNSLGIYRMADFDWMQEDGAVLARQVGSGATESYEATLVCDMEFATTARNHQGRLEGIAP